MSAKILEWRPMRRNSLLGFAKVEFPSGMVMNDVTVLHGKYGPWASPPSKPKLDRDGNVLKDEAGKTEYAQIVEFVTKEIRGRWSATVIAAMRESHPEVFDDGDVL